MTAGPRRDDAWSGMGTGWAISATLLGGMLAWGGVGYLIDRLLGTVHVFTAIGFVLGGIGAIYVVYLKYGGGDGGDDGA
jgi:F0F1-type ATP synthase assembly protein I